MPPVASPAVTLNAKYVAYVHTLLAYAAFFSALVVSCSLHYHKIVKNSSFGYPDEWFPSVSAAIGDWYPERSIFQLLIACTSGPRFLLVFINFLVLYSATSAVSSYVFLVVGILRTITCGGWVYITSNDDHDWHDIFMISYIILTLPWTVLGCVLSPSHSTVRRGRVWIASMFFATLVPLVYFFIQHKVHVVAGAYSRYAYCEWALILLDIAFDAWSAYDFLAVQIVFLAPGIVFSVEPQQQSVPVEKSNKRAAVATDDVDFGPVAFLVNIVNAHFLWTVFTSLLLCVWYFPLWYMGVSGYEVTVAVIFMAPLVASVPPFSWLFVAFPQVSRLLAVVFGVGAYKFPDPKNKLMSVTAGVGFATAALVSEYRALSGSVKRLTSFWTSLVLGLFSTSVSKYANFSNNPAWAIMNSDNGGLNVYFLVVGAVAALLTPSPRNSLAPKPGSTATPARPGGSFMLAAVGLGAYFNLLKTFMSDSSTLVFWNWEGYPIRGPTAASGGLLHFSAFAAGIIASLKASPTSLSSLLYAQLAIVSTYLLSTQTNWSGFAGGLGLTFYLGSIGSCVAHAAVGYNVPALFFLAFLVSVVLYLASVWTVAYAFVPGGPYLREKSDAVLYASVAMLLGGVANYQARRLVPQFSRFAESSAALLRHTKRVLTVLVAFSAAAAWYRTPRAPFAPFNEKSQSFTAGVWCVHFGLDNDMWSSETRMLNLLRNAQVDVVGLLETDTERLIGGNRDFTQKIAHDLGMYVDYGPGPNKHTWGVALLSKFPILNSTHHLTPSPVGELAPAIHATLDIYGELVDVVVFHSGQEEDVEDRRLQSLAVQRILGSSLRPLVLLSYLVTQPLQGNYNTYVSRESNVYDIDSTDWDRWCEYILFRGLKKVAYARISRSSVTDTELQVAKFKHLTDEQRGYSDDFLYGNHYVAESAVPADLRMPALLRGDGVQGHFYHVFDEPRYFAELPADVGAGDKCRGDLGEERVKRWTIEYTTCFKTRRLKPPVAWQT